MSNADRARRHKAKLAARGLAQVNLWLPVHTIPDFKLAAERVTQGAPHLTLGRLKDLRTGQVKGLK
jgi:hypothetical protein